MTNDEIKKMEDRQVPHGRIDLIGCGRLGLTSPTRQNRFDWMRKIRFENWNKPNAGSQRRTKDNRCI